MPTTKIPHHFPADFDHVKRNGYIIEVKVPIFVSISKDFLTKALEHDPSFDPEKFVAEHLWGLSNIDIQYTGDSFYENAETGVYDDETQEYGKGMFINPELKVESTLQTESRFRPLGEAGIQFYIPRSLVPTHPTVEPTQPTANPTATPSKPQKSLADLIPDPPTHDPTSPEHDPNYLPVTAFGEIIPLETQIDLLPDTTQSSTQSDTQSRTTPSSRPFRPTYLPSRLPTKLSHKLKQRSTYDYIKLVASGNDSAAAYKPHPSDPLVARTLIQVTTIFPVLHNGTEKQSDLANSIAENLQVNVSLTNTLKFKDIFERDGKPVQARTVEGYRILYKEITPIHDIKVYKGEQLGGEPYKAP